MQNHHRLPHGTFDGMDKEEEVLPMKSHKLKGWQLKIDIFGLVHIKYFNLPTKLLKNIRFTFLSLS